MGKDEPCPIPNPPPRVTVLDVQCMLPHSTAKRLQVQNVELSFGQRCALITAQKVQGALRNSSDTSPRWALALLCKF